MGFHHTDRKRLVPRIGPVPEIISRIPRPYPSSGEELGKLISDALWTIWMGVLSKEDHVDSSKFSPADFEKLDALILKQAETLGWRVALSELVHRRFWDWDLQPNGPALFEQYGKVLARSARRFQKKGFPPIDDPDLHLVKQETVQELRELLPNVRKAFSASRSRPTSDQLIDFFQKNVSAEGDAFIHLKTNINSWVQFFRADSTTIKSFLLRKRASPAALFDSWLAWSKGFEPETVRQKISEIGRFRSRS